MMSHTPGSNHVSIADPWTDDCGCSWAKGFIRRCPLHAAAPDLLAACRSALKRFKDEGWSVSRHETMKELDAAIARAEGK